ncbi:hypothetical protein BDK51DRAFT_16734, partial [Blyttiomyces helicus]
SVLYGDKFSEVFLNETPNGTPRPERDINMETQFEYGSRCGVWRLLRLFKEREFRFTCYAVGKAVEGNSEAIRAMHKDGHEVASHSTWIDYSKLTEEEEREHIRATIKAISDATGKPPRGWYTGRISQRSRRLVWEEYKKAGIPLLYDCDAYNDDLPYWVNVDGEGHLIIPYTLDQNDMKFAVAPGFTSPSGFTEYLTDAFDTLLAEGRSSTSPAPKLMSVGLHCRLAGKPGRAAALARFLDHVKSHPDVWVCTREEVANHWRSKFPYQK